jgi:major membrane immunogen (membrane-anchored lipoprotein)
MTLSSSALYVRQAAEMFLLDTCTIRQFTGYTVTDGEYIESFTNHDNIKCRIVNKSGKSVPSFSDQEQQVQILKNQQNTKIQLPYDVEVTTKDKVLFNGSVYDITDVPIKHTLMAAFIVSIEKQK